MKTINVKISELKELKLGEELKVDSSDYIYGFTKQEILGDEYLIFGLYGSGLLEMMLIEGDWTNNEDYKKFKDSINNKFEIKIKILLNK